ncbi:MAG: FliM/FliN family flagellar motor switch protein, partial [Rhizobiales bacterium]|nr:FliM/FliN family flagellar motor switch protein [Hyphomicrobiales bacterium]
ALAYACYALTTLAARVFVDRGVMAGGPVMLVRLGGLIAAAAAVLIAVAPNPTWALVAFGILGFGAAPVIPRAFTAAAQHDPAGSGVAIARVNVFNYVGFVVGAPLIGLVADVQIRFERSETRMDFAVIGRRSNPAVVSKYLLQAINRGGEMFVAIPQSALTPMRRSLSSLVSSESNGRDPNWARQIHDEVQRTEVVLRGVIEERGFTLDDVARFKVGQTLLLQATPRTPIRLQSTDQPLFWTRIGQHEGHYTLSIEEPIDHKQEFIDDILFG